MKLYSLHFISDFPFAVAVISASVKLIPVGSIAYASTAPSLTFLGMSSIYTDEVSISSGVMFLNTIFFTFRETGFNSRSYFSSLVLFSFISERFTFLFSFVITDIPASIVLLRLSFNMIIAGSSCFSSLAFGCVVPVGRVA